MLWKHSDGKWENNEMRSVGDKVELMPGGYGGLNAIFLHEEGVIGQMVPIVAVDGAYKYTVVLPSGYKLGIDERDIAKG